MTHAILIDTDPGVDDALALFLALGLPNVVLSEVTTCAGNASLNTVSRNAHYILERVGAQAIPVSRGAEKPLVQEPITAVVHGEGALGCVAIPSQWKPATPDATTALGAMQRFLRNNETAQRTIVALAPLTNLAELLSKSASDLRATDRVVILGGTHKGPGNKGPVAEFNFRCDPEAADIVLEKCPCDISVVPLDQCMRNTLSLKDFERIKDLSFRAFLEDLCRDYETANDSEEGIKGILMYDPLAIFCAARPELFTFERVWMRVDTGNSFARGMSVVDRRLRSNLVPNISVATDVNWDLFVDSFFEAVNSLSFRAN